MVAVTDVQLFANNKSAVLNNDVAVPDGSLVLASGQGTGFPAPVAGEYFAVTIQNTSNGAIEVCYCTARTGDILSVERAQEGTTALAFAAATAIVQLRATRGSLEKLIQRRFTGAQAGQFLRVLASGQVETVPAPGGGIETVVPGAGIVVDDSDPANVIVAVDLTYSFDWTGIHTFSDLVDLKAEVRLSGVITPSQITADQNDYSPTGLLDASHLRLSSDADRNITGLATGGAGRYLDVSNLGEFSIYLVDQSGSSSAANRFSLAANLQIPPGSTVHLLYDGTSSRWRAFSADLVVAPSFNEQAENPGTGYYHCQEFMVEPTVLVTGGWDIVTTGTGANVRGHSVLFPGHPGIVELDAGTAGGYASVIHAEDAAVRTPAGLAVGGGAIVVNCVFRFETGLPDASNFISPRIGLMSDGSEEPFDGIYIDGEMDGSVFKLIGTCRDNDAEVSTSVGAGFAVSADTWYHGRIEVNAAASSVEFFVNGTSLGTVSSGIPTTRHLTEGASYQRISTSGTELHLLVDVVECSQVFTTPRWVGA